MESYLVQTTSKIAGLAKSGRVTHARKLFDEMPHRDSCLEHNAHLLYPSRSLPRISVTI
ncbi:putative pentatricopeptide [Helianthus debilis subsp. tardiflorus]